MLQLTTICSALCTQQKETMELDPKRSACQPCKLRLRTVSSRRARSQVVEQRCARGFLGFQTDASADQLTLR